MSSSQTWGLSATILAPAEDILRFAAFHLEAGAHRLYIYLDDENPVAFGALKAHPKVRVTQCNAAWWAKKTNGRPAKHQARQTMNATHAYHRKAEVDWLIHMDVDEFLVSDQPIAAVLAGIPANLLSARARPMEALAGDATVFKGFIPGGPARDKIVKDIYPTFGPHIKGGFLSHLAGKVFIRTRLPDIEVKIHNAFQSGDEVKGADLDQGTLALAHCHAKTWEAWLTAYRYRLSKGSYRSELSPNRSRDVGGLSMYELFTMIENTDGEAGLRAFFDEVCADTPALRARLQQHGLLRKTDLNLDAALATHFPNVTP
ncbi:MAG: glycosyltransferase family 2 protein [Sulfitobacter sp.]